MIGRDPEIGENFSIKHTVDNDVQLGFIKTHETNLVGYLRKELNNYSIQLTVKEETAADGKLFSSKDKFEDRSEERRVGKECRSRRRPAQERRKQLKSAGEK